MRVRSGAPVGPAPPTMSTGRPAGAAPPRPFTTVLGEQAGTRPVAARDAVPVSAPQKSPGAPNRPQPGTSPAPPSPVRALLEQTLDAEQRVNTLLAAAARGKTFSPAELLALQASVFRASQAVEVVSRAADKLVGAVKQTVGTQV